MHVLHRADSLRPMVKLLHALVPADQMRTPLKEGNERKPPTYSLPTDSLQETFKSAGEVVGTHFAYRETETQGGKDPIPRMGKTT